MRSEMRSSCGESFDRRQVGRTIHKSIDFYGGCKQMQETNAQRAYDYLRNCLVQGEFLPGARIRYGPVGKKLGISATPVREAIGQLANEGFVELVPQLGAVVRQISRDEVIELYELREAIEPYATARAAERIEQSQLDQIGKQLDRMTQLTERTRQSSSRSVPKKTVRSFEQADLAFHMLIIEATGNRTMLRTVGNSHLLTGIFSVARHGYDAGVMQATCDDHRRILTSLQRKKPDAARDAMAVHIRNGLEVSLAGIIDDDHRWWDASTR
ncbi:GntR family transcriptional regulator [Crateriforma conspicua]|nr:GntR family transcriptional regulator [Crateriforma conspicua]